MMAIRKFIAVAQVLIAALSALFLGSCASTRVTTHVIGSQPPLCQEQTKAATALILWGAAWRDNQKETAQREEMAARAIDRYFKTSSCYAKVEVLRMASGRQAIGLSDVEALKLGMSRDVPYDKIILVRLEELGPFIILYLSPVLWEGGTIVQFRIRVLDAHTSSLEADITSHWKNGGAFVLKGTGTLEQDLEASLASVFGEANRVQNKETAAPSP